MHVVKALELPETGRSFPLREEYDRLNHTLEGLREVQKTRAQESDILAPPLDDFNPDAEGQLSGPVGPARAESVDADSHEGAQTALRSRGIGCGA